MEVHNQADCLLPVTVETEGDVWEQERLTNVFHKVAAYMSCCLRSSVLVKAVEAEPQVGPIMITHQ